MGKHLSVVSDYDDYILPKIYANQILLVFHWLIEFFAPIWSIFDGFHFFESQVVSDPVGYGFVIRGSRPVYVHTVDPSGPAANAGLQVGGH